MTESAALCDIKRILHAVDVFGSNELTTNRDLLLWTTLCNGYCTSAFYRESRSIVTESCHCQNTKYNSCFLAVWLPTYVFYIVKNSRDDEKVSFIKPKSVNYFRIVLPGIDL